MLRSGAAIASTILFLFALQSADPGKSVIVPAGQQNPEDFPARIDRLNPAIDAIVPENAMWHRVATGLTWVEGPVWIHSGYLMFADIDSNSIRKISPDGKVAIWLQPSGYRNEESYGGKEPGTNGMTLDVEGRLTVAGHADRNVIRFESMDPHGFVTILADTYKGKKLNSPNDLVYGADGSLYFTDPPYGLRQQSDTDPQKELTVNGVYRIQNATKQKPGTPPERDKLQLLISDLPRPNGIALSPDGKWLYISESLLKRWMRYPIMENGDLGPGTVFVDAYTDRRPGAPDGMKVDTQGNIYASGPGGVWVISPSGKHLGTILTDKNTANLAWGGDDGMTLYVTATDSVFSIHLNVKGLLP
jgi:gluconolactonase